MPSIGHIAVGAAAGRLSAGGDAVKAARAMTVLSALSLLPDADGIAFPLGIPYGAPLGHRGAAHSLFAAAGIGAAAALLGRRWKIPPWKAGLYAGAVTASHGLLDAMTDGGMGIALLWPFSNRRFFLPWRPIPVAPIALGMFSRRGLEVVAAEVVFFLPLFLYAFWPRRR